jgi:hypothetical protein
MDFVALVRSQISFSFPFSPIHTICDPHYAPLTSLSARHSIQTVPFEEFASDESFCESLHCLSFRQFRFRTIESQPLVKRDGLRPAPFARGFVSFAKFRCFCLPLDRLSIPLEKLRPNDRCSVCPRIHRPNQIGLPKIHKNDVFPDKLLFVSMFNSTPMTLPLKSRQFYSATDSSAFLISAVHRFRRSFGLCRGQRSVIAGLIFTAFDIAELTVISRF